MKCINMKNITGSRLNLEKVIDYHPYDYYGMFCINVMVSGLNRDILYRYQSQTIRDRIINELDKIFKLKID